MNDEIISKGDEYVLMDSNGAIRVPDRLRMDKEEAKELADFLFMKTKKHIGVKKLDVTFQELDNVTGKKRTHTQKKWTTEEEAKVLINMDEDDATIGEKLQRSNMSVFFHMKPLNQEFNLWKETEGKAFVLAGEPREKLVKRFLWKDPEHE